jgi:hypothetical protein
LFAFTFYYTGTKANGTVDTNTCTNWTSSVGAAQFGGTEDASGWWTERGGVGCNTILISLLCLQAGAGKPLPSLPAVPSGAKRVFVTSVQGQGDLSAWAEAGGNTGVAAGDAICVARATAAGLANAANFKAWLSDTSTDAIDHVTAGATTDGPFYRLDDVKIADNKGTLKTAPLFTAIALDENGTYTVDLGVWSGTDDTGIKTANRCVDWGSSANGDHGKIGVANTASTYWTNFTDETCDTNAALYCFEDD